MSQTQAKLKLRAGDTVRVLRGKDRGKKGRVIAVLPQVRRVVVEGINLMKKHIKPRRTGEKGQRVSIAAPMHVSSVQVVCPSCQKSTRVGVVRENGVRQRICRKCEALIPNPE